MNFQNVCTFINQVLKNKKISITFSSSVFVVILSTDPKLVIEVLTLV
jgi:hypothetical protein